LSPRLAVLGNIKIGRLVPVQGQEGKYRPEKLDRFVVTTMIRDQAGYKEDLPLMQKLLEMQRRRIANNIERQLSMEIAIREDLAGRRMADKDRAALAKSVRERYVDALRTDKVKSIDIMLPFEEVEQNLSTSLAVYDGRGCRCRGEGNPDKMADYIDPETGEVTNVDCCPCNMLKPDLRPHPYLKPNPQRGVQCKPHAILRCMITGAKTLGGVHVLRTTSWNTISQLLGSMSQIMQITGGLLAYIPLLLTVRPRTTVITMGDGRQSYQRIYVVDMTYQKEMLEFLEDVARLAHQRAQMRAQIQSRDVELLPAPGHESPDEQRIISAEFAPAEEGEAEGELLPESEDPAVADDAPPQEPKKAPQSASESGGSEGSGEPPPPQDEPPPPQDEPPPPDGDPAEASPFPTVDPTTEEDETEATKEERREFISIGRAAGYNNDQLRDWMSQLWGVESSAGMKSWQVKRMVTALETKLQNDAGGTNGR
jgi:hypothetical protein